MVPLNEVPKVSIGLTTVDEATGCVTVASGSEDVGVQLALAGDGAPGIVVAATTPGRMGDRCVAVGDRLVSVNGDACRDADFQVRGGAVIRGYACACCATAIVVCLRAGCGRVCVGYGWWGWWLGGESRVCTCMASVRQQHSVALAAQPQRTVQDCIGGGSEVSASAMITVEPAGVIAGVVLGWHR